MDEKYRGPLVRARLSNYYTVLATTIIAFVAIAAVITVAEVEHPAMFVVLIVTVSIYGILAGHAALQDLKALIKDMDGDIKDTAFGAAVSARNMAALSAASAGLIGLTGLALVGAIIS